MTRSRVAHASIWAVAGSMSQYLITFGLLVFLARVLDPRDFGLMATVTIGLDLGMQIARWGQVELLQQSRYQSDDARNQALRMSLAIAFFFAATFVVSAPALARAYESPELATMMYLSAPVFLFSSMSATAEGILRNQFRFQTLAFRGSVTAVLGGIVAIALALTGFGALALAAQRFVQSAISVIWVWAAVDWRPRFKGKITFSRPLMNDGASTMTGAILPILVPRSIDLFVSVMLGPAALGLMKIAFRILEFIGQLVIMPLVGVAHAQLARFADDHRALRQSYLRFTQLSAALICPLMIGFALVAPEAVPILFGDKWATSIPLVQLVSILALTAPPNYFFPGAMIAIGHSRLVLRQGVFQIIVGLSLAAIAVQYSLTAVLITQIIRGVVLTGYNFVDLRRHVQLGLREFVRALAPPYVATGFMTAAVVGARAGLPDGMSPLDTMLLLSGVGGITYVATIIIGARLRLWPDFLAAIIRLYRDRSRTPVDDASSDLGDVLKT